MIYTVTLNPSLDYAMYLDRFDEGFTNRSNKEELTIGGKGINVSMMLSNLGMNSIALGFAGGFTGRYILDMLDILGIDNDFIFIDDILSRINIKVKTSKESEINANGPSYTDDNISSFIQKIDSIKDGDTMILAGSIPKSFTNEIYCDIMEKLQSKNVKIIVDTTAKLLLNVLKYKPFLIKPNKDELEELFSVEINSDKDVFKYAQKLVDMGAKNIIVSMGSDGAIFVNENLQLKSDVPKGKLINSVGAGDSMIAGFVYGLEILCDYEKSFKYAVAAGSATAFSTHLATKSKVEELLKMI